ncbi:MAG TPA: S66 peptidase family protein [Acidimicrobiia bacterium]|nr:S66 peptidase family protein [Acidimicrobiia bacterium]
MLAKPPRLQKGDRVAAVSLSWGGPAVLPGRYEAGRKQLEEAFGVEVVEMPHTLADPTTLAAHPGARADDLHRALSDPAIAGVVTTSGGDDSIRILPHLELGVIAENPKVLLGYSDTTITQMAFLRAGVTSFYGPAMMAGFAESGGLHGYLTAGVTRMLFEPEPTLVWPENDAGWTVEFQDRADPAHQSRARQLQPSTPWRWHGGTTTEGISVVGCLEVLDWLRGTEWWPSLDGRVLMLETSEEAPPPEALTRFLRILGLTGELQALAGIVLGRPGGSALPLDRHVSYDEAVLGVVRAEHGLDLPVVTNVDFGHTDPIWTVPQGIPVRLDPEARQITFLDTAVS